MPLPPEPGEPGLSAVIRYGVHTFTLNKLRNCFGYRVYLIHAIHEEIGFLRTGTPGTRRIAQFWDRYLDIRILAFYRSAVDSHVPSTRVAIRLSRK